jgi:hypothetical protein
LVALGKLLIEFAELAVVSIRFTDYSKTIIYKRVCYLVPPLEQRLAATAKQQNFNIFYILQNAKSAPAVFHTGTKIEQKAFYRPESG